MVLTPRPRNDSVMAKRRSIDTAGVDALLARDDKVATHAELHELGMPKSTVTYRIREGGPWGRLLPGVIVAHSGMASWHQRELSAMKYAGSRAVVTGLAALRHHKFRNLPHSLQVHVLIPHEEQRKSSEYVITERTTRLPEAERVNGVSYAPVARAVIDACKRMHDLDAVRALVAEAVQSGKCHPRELLEELQASSRAGTGLPRRVMKEISAGIRSVAEAKAREILRRGGVPEPEWNVTIEDTGGNRIADPDGYWELLGVALEIDSMTWHLGPRSYKRTQHRQRKMTSHGILVVATAPGDIYDDPDEFLASVKRTLAVAASRPAPAVRVRRRPAA